MTSMDEDIKAGFLQLLRGKNLRVGDTILGPWLAALYNQFPDLTQEQLGRVSDALRADGYFEYTDGKDILKKLP